MNMDDSFRTRWSRGEPKPPIQITRLTGVGLAIIAAAVAAVLVLGLSSVRGQFPTGDAYTRSCGSVFIPDDDALRIRNLNCRESLDSRRDFLLAVGIPSLVLGLGVAWAGTQGTSPAPRERPKKNHGPQTAWGGWTRPEETDDGDE